MKCDAVIEAITRERLNALHMLGREIWPQRNDDTPFGRIDDKSVLRVIICCHRDLR